MIRNVNEQHRVVGALAFLLFSLMLITPQNASANLQEPDLSIMLSLRDTYGWGTVFSWPQANPCPNDTVNWGGIGCTQGRVISFNLGCPSRFLEAPIPPILGGLAHLQEVSIRGCRVRGSYPWLLGNNPLMNVIRLDINQLSGTLDDFFPDGISPSQFPQLTASGSLLNLSENDITGSIPAGLMQFNSNLNLNLNYLRLTGALPAAGNPSKRINISRNGLSGSLPDYMACAGTANCNVNYNMFDVVNTPVGMTNFSWRATQTVPPTNIQVTPTGAGSVHLTWTPIEYQIHGGYYEVLSSLSPGGPYISRGKTNNIGGKAATGLVISGLPGGTNYFVVRTTTPPFTQYTPTVTRINSKMFLTSINSAEVSTTVGTSLVVTKTGDTNDGVCDSDCSLREALHVAHSGDSITFSSQFDLPRTITLTQGQLTIPSGRSISIIGKGPQLTKISGGSLQRVFEVNVGASLRLDGLTVTNGTTAGYGGGINNHGTLILERVAIDGNQATSGSGGINSDNDSVLYITDSTISNNLSGVNAGGIQVFYANDVKITNSTISGNIASGFGGGLNIDVSPVVLRSVTITDNEAANNNGGISNYLGTLSSKNSIIAGNRASNGNLDIGGDLASEGANLIGDTTGTVVSGIVVGNVLNQNPRLAPLGNYGGPTMTHALLSGSPAIEGSRFGNDVPAEDQRGVARTGFSDIGAFELNNSANGGGNRVRLPNAHVGVPFVLVLANNGGAFTFSVTSGDLPQGLQLTTSLAPAAVVSISGTPLTGVLDHEFSVTVSDGTNSVVTDYVISVLAPTSSAVSLSGQVMTANGVGVRNAVISIKGPGLNEPQVKRTGAFGHYAIEGLVAGETYIVTVSSPRHTFGVPSRVVTLSDSISDLNFIAMPSIGQAGGRDVGK